VDLISFIRKLVQVSFEKDKISQEESYQEGKKEYELQKRQIIFQL